MYFLPVAFIFALLIALFASISTTKNAHALLLSSLSCSHLDQTTQDFQRRMERSARGKFYAQSKTQTHSHISHDRQLHGRLNIFYLRQNSEGKATNPDREKAAHFLLVRLIQYLYKDKPFFKEGQEKYPELADTIVTALFDHGRDSDNEHHFLQQAKHLANVNVGDSTDLQMIIYKILHGKGVSATSKETYPQLFDFIELQPNQKALFAVWHASNELLMALFKDEGTVNELINKRKEIYGRMPRRRSKPTEQEFAEQIRQYKTENQNQLEFEFQKKLPSEIRPEWIDFGVSTAQPLTHDEDDDDEDA